MTGFEPQTSDDRIDLSANWAKNAACLPINPKLY